MSYNEYVDYDSGRTLYCKPRPTVEVPWPDDRIIAVESGTSGEYLFAALADGVQYRVYEQLGATAEATDPPLFRIDPPASQDLTAIETELAKVIKTGEQFQATSVNDTPKDVTFTRLP